MSPELCIFVAKTFLWFSNNFSTACSLMPLVESVHSIGGVVGKRCIKSGSELCILAKVASQILGIWLQRLCGCSSTMGECVTLMSGMSLDFCNVLSSLASSLIDGSSFWVTGQSVTPQSLGMCYKCTGYLWTMDERSNSQNPILGKCLDFVAACFPV